MGLPGAATCAGFDQFQLSSGCAGCPFDSADILKLWLVPCSAGTEGFVAPPVPTGRPAIERLFAVVGIASRGNTARQRACKLLSTWRADRKTPINGLAQQGCPETQNEPNGKRDSEHHGRDEGRSCAVAPRPG